MQKSNTNVELNPFASNLNINGSLLCVMIAYQTYKHIE